MKTVKKLLSRLGDRRGETLVEALVSILIFTLSSIILLTMISAASRINKNAQDADEERQSQLIIAEAGTASMPEISVTVRDISSSTFKFFVEDEIYTAYLAQKDAGALYSYFRLNPGEAE